MQIRKYTALLSAALMTLSAVRAQQFQLLGHIDGQQNGYVHLYYRDANGGNVSDSTDLKNGDFVFTGNIPGPVMAYFTGNIASTSMDDPNSTSFFLEPATIYFRGKAGDLKNAVIKGSKTQKEYETLNKELSPVLEEMKPLDSQYAIANKAYMDAVKSKKDEAVLTALKEKAAAVHDAFEPFQQKIATISYRYFITHPDSYVTAFQLRFYTGSLPVDSLQMFYDNMGGPVRQSVYGKEIAGEIKKLRAGSPGSVAANFTATDINGKVINLSDFKGKYVILDFWASWCIPCRHSNPHMIALYKKYHDKGLEIIGISDDDNHKDAWEKAVEKDGVGIWHNVLRGFDEQKNRQGIQNDRDISEKYGIHSLPTKILIDKNGVIIGRYDHGTDEETATMNSQLATAFK